MKRVMLSDVGRKQGNVLVEGWVQDIRILKNISFIVLRDSSGLAQITLKRNTMSNYDSIISVNRESVIEVIGDIVKDSVSKTGPEIMAHSVNILNRAEAPLPLGITDPVGADLETRLNHRYLDLRKTHNSVIFLAENSLLWGIRSYLKRMGFVEVHTPKIVAAATEGGADLFPVKYFDREVYLNQSPQLYKEILISSGINRVFEVGPAFRAEKHNTVRHLNEFTSIDIEMAFSDHNDAMKMLENSVFNAAEYCLKENGDILENAGYIIEKVRKPFPRITFRECVEILEKEGSPYRDGEDFSPENLKVIGSRFDGFYFITQWPAALRPFYTMPSSDNPEYTNSFDLQLREIEVTSGAMRVHDPDLLRKRFTEKGLNSQDFQFYLDAFRYGMPPHAGWAIGLERLTMILLNLPNIREASLFPRDRTRVSP
ncbi:MAG: aspartate--tRNA(Asn) ligase [Candidatus Thermoplasmatota archaeon]|nr:aspartate--tRNA(Asn) ligase [Candidatus Thermoplasmatota archaeon]